MKKATDALLSDHKMIRKLLENFDLDNPRFDEISRTLERVVLTHAWFEDVVFLPAFKNEPSIGKRYIAELTQEHRDIDDYFSRINTNAQFTPKERGSHVLQLRAVLSTHLTKEEEALFPLATSILDDEGLNRLGAEMEKRQGEPRDLFLNVKRS